MKSETNVLVTIFVANVILFSALVIPNYTYFRLPTLEHALVICLLVTGGGLLWSGSVKSYSHTRHTFNKWAMAIVAILIVITVNYQYFWLRTVLGALLLHLNTTTVIGEFLLSLPEKKKTTLTYVMTLTAVTFMAMGMYENKLTSLLVGVHILIISSACMYFNYKVNGSDV